MKGFKFAGIFGVLLAALALLGQISGASAQPVAQIPTVDIATVTGTPSGAMAVVKVGEQDQINVRSGPGTSGYDIIGVLVVGQSVPALGRSVGGDWVQIAYPGAPNGVAWVYSPLVDLSGPVPIVEPPPTPTPRTTPTIDPTLAAQFLVEVQPTRLPTFTPPAPVVQPTFIASSGQAAAAGRIPMGMVIVAMLVVGFFGMLISILSGR
jgi:uncharacterized protein YraI